MEIRYFSNKKIDKQKWDSSIDNSHNKNIFGYSWYLDNISPNWNALIADDYEILLPLPTKNFFFFKLIYMPPFINRVNIYSKQKLTNQIVDLFLKKIPLNNFVFSLNIQDLNFFPEKFNCKLKANQILTFNQNYKEIYNTFSKSNKRNIDKALKYNVEIKKSDNFENLISFQKHINIKKKLSIKNKFFENLKNLFQYAKSKNKCQIFEAYYNGEICAAVLFLNNFDIVTLFSGTNEIAKKNGAFFLIFDEYLRSNCNKNFKIDFAGSSIQGIKDRNIGFGAENFSYTVIESCLVSKLKKVFY